MIPKKDLMHLARGFLMGGADVIPGVSGGTVALILGIYERLVRALSHIDGTLVGHLCRRDWTAAARRVDLRFLLALGSGIALGIVSLATLMHHLLSDHRQYTFAAFFGLILGSSLLVARMVARWTPTAVVLGTAAVAGAYVLVGLPMLHSPPAGNGYVFLCGMVGICAMILPGISGAFVLLILGKYADVTGLLKDVLHGEATVAGVVTIGVFCTGCAVGLLVFSKFLRWLLARHEGPTMAALCGLMLGSLRRIWPFKIDLTPEVAEFRLKRFGNVWPESFDASAWVTVAIALAGLLAVLALDGFTQAHEHVPPLDEHEPEPQGERTMETSECP